MFPRAERAEQKNIINNFERVSFWPGENVFFLQRVIKYYKLQHPNEIEPSSPHPFLSHSPPKKVFFKCLLS